MQIHIRKSSFEEIEPIWREYLWPNRNSPLKAMSPISMDLTFCESILSSHPTFYATQNNKGGITGVISGYKSADNLYRSRGLFVFPEYRKQGLSQQLLRTISEQAKTEKCTKIWTLPRQTAWPAYEKFGFVKSSDWFTEKMEFGPNCIAVFNLS